MVSILLCVRLHGVREGQEGQVGVRIDGAKEQDTAPALVYYSRSERGLPYARLLGKATLPAAGTYSRTTACTGKCCGTGQAPVPIQSDPCHVLTGLDGRTGVARSYGALSTVLAH